MTGGGRRGAWPPVSRPAGAAAPVRGRAPAREGDVAIVGLGCVLPGGLDPGAFWQTLLDGRSAIGPIPPDRWDEARYHDPSAGIDGPTLSYARLAAAVRGFTFDPLAFRIPPKMAPTLDPSQRMALVAAEQAVRQAGWDRAGFDRSRAAVVLGNAMGGEFAKSMAVRIRFRDVLDAVARDPIAQGWSLADQRALEARVEAALAPRLPPVEVDSMAGLLSNVVAGRVAAWLDWMGGNLTVDAACAASLASVAIAVDWLRNGRCDAVLAGGVDTDLSPETFVGFCRTEALSRTGAQPFSALADGFVMGEGAAVLALMRATDAARQGRPALALIRGVGQSSDGRGRGITAPRAEGQDLAIGRAWAEAALDPGAIGLVEAHGTGTAVGDETEIGVLARRFAGAETPTWLGSVKSNVGHLKSAAGAVALLKATLSLAAGVVPPTLHAGPVHPGLPLCEGPLRLPRTAVPLPRGGATVSAFGFGGTNFHLVLSRGDASDPHPTRTRGAAIGRGPALDRAWGRGEVARALFAWGAGSEAALAEAVAEGRVVAPEEAAAAPARAVALAAPGEDPAARVLRALAGAPERDVWLGSGPPAAVHLLFPGQGAQEAADESAARRMPAALAALAPLRSRIERDLGLDFEGILDQARDGEVVAVHAVGLALGAAHAAALADAGIPIAAVLGHSLGALPAAVAAGAWSAADAWTLARARGEALAACPEGRMVAVRGEEPPPPELFLAAINADDQQVMCGDPAPTEAFARALGPSRARLLAVRRAFHSPRVAPAAEALARALAAAPPPLAPRTPVWSSRTARVEEDLPTDLVAAVTAPVRFRDALRALPPGLCVDAGPGETMANLAARAGHRAVALAGPDGPARAAGALLAAGHPGLAASLPDAALRRAPPPPSGLRRPATVAPAPTPPPAPAEPGDDDVRAAVVAVVGRITGYPPEWITEGADLEADLGVDSIRKMEILGALEKRFGFRTPEAEYAALRQSSLASLVAHVERHAGQGTTAATAAEPGLFLAVAAPAGGPPPDPDLDVEAAVARIQQVARDAGEASPAPGPLRSDPAGRAVAAWLRSWSRETGRPVAASAGAEVRARPLSPDRGEALPEGLVFLCTGGLRGILAPCLLALADRSPRVVLLHRPGHAFDPASLPFPILGVAGDAADPADARRAVAAALGVFGRVDVVVHAAGALRDGPWDAAGPEDVAAVVRPKWGGARALADATADEPLRAFVTFSSLAAHLGNPGQTVYAAANAAMETVRHPTARTLHLAFGAWDGVGMAAGPAVSRLLRARGVVPLAPDDGARAFRSLLEGRGSGVVWVGAQPLPGAEPLPWPLGPVAWREAGAVACCVPLEPSDPWLADHRVAGRPLAPAAAWVEAMLVAAREAVGGDCALASFEVLAPTFVDAPRGDVRLVLRHASAPITAEILAGGAIVCRARIVPAVADDAPPPPSRAPTDDAAPLYRGGPLFHGPSWQLLARTWDDGDGFGADLSGAAGPGGVAGAVDAIHQLLAVHAARRRGVVGLPVGADRWASFPGGPPVRFAGRSRGAGDEARADVAAWDADGRTVLRGDGVRIRAARASGGSDG